MRAENLSLHQRQNTVKSLFEASGSEAANRQSDAGARRHPSRYQGWLASAGIRTEIPIVLARDILPLIGISGVGLLTRDVGPSRGVLTVEL